LSAKHFLALALVSGYITFAPDQWLGQLGLRDFRLQQRQWISLAFLVSVALTVTYATSALTSKIRKTLAHRNRMLAQREFLANLGEDEKEVLRMFLSSGHQTHEFRIDDGAVNSLAMKGFLFRPGQMTSNLDRIPYGIQLWVLLYLRKNPQLLHGRVRLTSST
jgi:hypothetical protein